MGGIFYILLCACVYECVCVRVCACVWGGSYFPHVTLHSTAAEESQSDLKVAFWFPYAGLFSLNDFMYIILKIE